MARSYRDLVVWQKGIRLTVVVYQISKAFPRDEIYGLTSQTRHAAVSIPSNIAEGAGRLKTTEYRHFLGIARGSNFELQTHLTIAKEFGFGDADQIALAEGSSDEVGKMIFATLEKLKERLDSETVNTSH
jgi:four helix bundle protein